MHLMDWIKLPSQLRQMKIKGYVISNMNFLLTASSFILAFSFPNFGYLYLHQPSTTTTKKTTTTTNTKITTTTEWVFFYNLNKYFYLLHLVLIQLKRIAFISGWKKLATQKRIQTESTLLLRQRTTLCSSVMVAGGLVRYTCD